MGQVTADRLACLAHHRVGKRALHDDISSGIREGNRPIEVLARVLVHSVVDPECLTPTLPLHLLLLSRVLTIAVHASAACRARASASDGTGNFCQALNFIFQ